MFISINQTTYFMKSKISFSGDPRFIARIADYAAQLQMDYETSEPNDQTESLLQDNRDQVGSTSPFEIGADGLIIVPPKKQREKAEYKAHREAAEKARAEQELQLAVPVSQVATQQQAPTEPNAFANYAIQQQAQFAQQPVQQAPSFPQQATGFPAAAPAQTPTGFPASNPAQAPVATNGQPWLNPATINQQGPTINDFNTLIQPLVVHERPRQILGEWLAHKQLQNFEQIADQPAVLAEAIQVATQIRDGILK